ncbi:glucan endo-1,3-alpha-glucosidase agn1 [Fonsecaea pedrosoi]|nr:glucan endo-1,3-alpha-glucosidase agn1 [Fonsecaea pedrosoi]
MLSLPLICLTFIGFASPILAQSVFAHVIVGNTYSYTQANWATDIATAAAAGIDGFALNVGYLDTINPLGFVQAQLDNAYQAADAAGFQMFLSFDYLAQGAWDQNAVIRTVNGYSSHASQFKWQGKPLVSTFEGADHAGDWAYIKAQTNCFFVPDFSSQGAEGAAGKPNVDGLLSWNAWPNGATDMTDDDDKAYVTALNGRPYMMPVSPWFYTNLPLWSKNWLWRGDDLWHHRWNQVLNIQPALVEILTSYKNKSRPDTSHVTFWYRLNPGSGSACGAGTTCNTPTQGQVALNPQECDIDAVFFTAFVPDTALATVNVTIGGSTQTVSATNPGIFHSSVPFNDMTGDVTVAVTASDGTEIGPVNGAPISAACAGADWIECHFPSTPLRPFLMYRGIERRGSVRVYFGRKLWIVCVTPNQLLTKKFPLPFEPSTLTALLLSSGEPFEPSVARSRGEECLDGTVCGVSSEQIPYDVFDLTRLKVTFIDKEGDEHTFEVAEGDNLLDIAQANDLEMEVDSDEMYDKIPEATDDENDMLDLAFGLTETSRLGCQVKMTKELDGLVVKLPQMTRNMQASDFEKRN